MNRLQVITFSDKPLDDDNLLVSSCKKYVLPLEIIKPNEDWKVNAQKIQLLVSYLSSYPNNDLLLIVDAFDVLIQGHGEDFIEYYKEKNAQVIFSAEANFYFRNKKLRKSYFQNYPESPTNYKYLNSGSFLGTRDAIQDLLNKIIITNNLDLNDINSFITVRSDQYLYSKYFVEQSKEHNPSIKLDYTHELMEVAGGRMRVFPFPSISNMHAYNSYKVERFILKLTKLNHFQKRLIDLKSENNLIINKKMKTTPKLIHLPGTWHSFKEVLNEIEHPNNQFTFQSIIALILAGLAHIVSAFIPVRLRL